MPNKSKTPTRKLRSLVTRRSKGQALVELAVGSVFLAMLLAGAIDMGRAYYTSVVVTSMAGEGARYAATNPGLDANYPNAGSCAEYGAAANNNIQDRARQVAAQRGMIIKQPSQANVTIQPSNCATRCETQPITVTVSYRLDDLFLPALVGRNVLTITKTSSQPIIVSSYAASQPTGACPAP
jgi:Flp pilus assembly protein TadG